MLILGYFLMFSCGNETVQNNCFRGVTLNETVNLNTPEFIDLQVPGSNTITRLGGRNIIIIRPTSSQYKVFDLQCPEMDCNTPMIFDGLKLKCSCNQKEYNSLNGSPINGKGCFALEYNVLQTSSSTLQITR